MTKLLSLLWYVPFVAGAATEPIAAFDFRQAAGSQEIRDQSGQFRCISDSGAFVVENDALRVAFGARFRVPELGSKLGEHFSISAWVLKSAETRIYRTPLVSCGYTASHEGNAPGRNEFDFLWQINGFVPEFQTYGGGLTVNASPYSGEFFYSDSSWRRHQEDEPVAMNRWQELTCVYDAGNITLYVDGRAVAAKPRTSERAPLLVSGFDLYIGALREKNEADNSVSAEMLINDLRFYNRALTAAEVAQDYAQSRSRFPETPVTLQATRAYFSEEMRDLDEEMTNRLPQTAAFAAQPPADPYPADHRIHAELRRNEGQVQLFLDGKPLAPVAANPIQFEPGFWTSQEFVRDFAAAGVTINLVGMPGICSWIGENEYDYSVIDRRIREAIAASPEARIVPVIFSLPPVWFHEKYPDELEEYYISAAEPELGKTKWRGSGAPLGSDVWLNLSLDMLRDFVRHCETSDYANHIVGYAFPGGDAGEWYWPGLFTGGGGITGYSAPTLANFRKFLQQKYATDAALQQAWSDPAVTRTNAEVPTPQERRATERGFFRDPAVARNVYDFRQFLNERTFFNFNESARVIREAAGSDRIIITYYGYPLYFAGRNWTLQYAGLQSSRDALTSPYIDMIATPVSYLNRRGGQVGANIAGFSGSAALHGKVICREEDIRTHFFPRMEFGRTSTLSETVQVMKRGYGYYLTDNYMMWYVCQGGNHSYHQEDMMRQFREFQQMADAAVTVDREAVAEVALIFDEKKSMDALAISDNNFITRHTWETYEAAHRMGTPFRLYYLEDLAEDAMPDYKLYVFLNPYRIEPALLAKIRRKMARNNAVAVWCYAPGFIGDAGFDVGNMRNVSGIQLKECEPGAFTVANVKSHPITRYVTGQRNFSCDPAFAVDDPDAEILAGSGTAGTLAVKGQDIYTLEPLSGGMLRGLAEYAGAHIYLAQDDVLTANRSYLMLIADEAGERTITLPAKATVTDAVTGAVIVENQSQFTVHPAAGATELYRLLPPTSTPDKQE